jgi:hypothetical protein
MRPRLQILTGPWHLSCFDGRRVTSRHPSIQQVASKALTPFLSVEGRGLRFAV